MSTKTQITQTPVEQWLGSLRLDAVEVDRCPVVDCELCSPQRFVVAA